MSRQEAIEAASFTSKHKLTSNGRRYPCCMLRNSSADRRRAVRHTGNAVPTLPTTSAPLARESPTHMQCTYPAPPARPKSPLNYFLFNFFYRSRSISLGSLSVSFTSQYCSASPRRIIAVSFPVSNDSLRRCRRGSYRNLTK